jgi:hypothetical protein
MGMIQQGAPFEIIKDLAKLSGITAFVETGTYHGNTTRWAAQHFDSVFTMEQAEGLYQQHHQELRALGNVEPLYGDSKILLPQVIAKLGGRPALFWLDGHWSGGETAGENDQCPLLSELETLKDRRGDILLIDDASLFLSVPPVPHDPAQWPTLPEIVRLLMKPSGQPYVQIIDDVIFSVPAEEKLKNRLIDYARVRSKAFGKLLTRGRRPTLGQKIKLRLAKISGG